MGLIWARVSSARSARDYDERDIVLKTIGPVWDGNEVWLIAAAGALYFAFPLLYASAFSGFYLSLMMVLWLLMFRGIGVELRSHFRDPLWWSALDFVFCTSSLLLAVFFGIAIGNVMRGVPLDAQGFFFEPLWTDFRVGENPGILDWYTALTALLALFAITIHGAHYVGMKTAGAINTRCRRCATVAWPGLIGLTIATLFGTVSIRPQILDNFRQYSWGWIIPASVTASLIAMRIAASRGRDGLAFASSTIFLAAMLCGAAFSTYPTLLPASTNSSYSITIYNARAGEYALRIGLVWWIGGLVLAIAYFAFVYSAFRGKIAQREVTSPEH
jgi:cytochrome d ubiquinol oxidase subunit II